MNFSKEGEAIDFAKKEFLAEGVMGYAIEHNDEIWIPVIDAVRPGNGDVGRFLDSLPPERTIVVPTVINRKLAGMLERRGFIYDSMGDRYIRGPK